MGPTQEHVSGYATNTPEVIAAEYVNPVIR